MFDIVQNYADTEKLLRTKRYEFAVVDLHLPDAADGQIVTLVNKYNIAPIEHTSKITLCLESILTYLLKN